MAAQGRTDMHRLERSEASVSSNFDMSVRMANLKYVRPYRGLCFPGQICLRCESGHAELTGIHLEGAVRECSALW